MTNRLPAGLLLLALCTGPALATTPQPVADQTITPPGRMGAFHQQTFRLPTADGTILEATLLLPTEKGPFPLAVVSGGATSVSRENHGHTDRFDYLSGYFLSRGYAVLRPMARGMGGSEGTLITGGCDLASVARRDAEDIRDIIQQITLLPALDSSRLVLSGLSFGGWLQMALGTMPVPGVKAEILFYPLMHESDCQKDSGSLLSGAEQAGQNSRVPVLWIQGENDSKAPASLWKEMFSRFHAGHPDSTLVNVGIYKNDSHDLLSDPDGLTPWIGAADHFLAAAGLPGTEKYPAYLPLLPPSASGYAALSDLQALPARTDQARTLYETFLRGASPRAFVIGDTAAAGTLHAADPIGTALQKCATATRNCRLYAYDDRVVWKGPATTAQAPISITLPKGQHASLFYSTLKPDCSPRFLATLHILKAPEHGTLRIVPKVLSHPHYSGDMAHCNAGYVQGSGALYVPTAGYSGPDSFTIGRQNSLSPADPTEKLDYHITVQ